MTYSLEAEFSSSTSSARRQSYRQAITVQMDYSGETPRLRFRGGEDLNQSISLGGDLYCLLTARIRNPQSQLILREEEPGALDRVVIRVGDLHQAIQAILPEFFTLRGKIRAAALSMEAA